MKGVTLVIIAIVAVVAILFILGGYFLYSSLSDVDVSDGGKPLRDDQTSLIPFQDEISRAIIENNVEICNEIGGSQKQVCIDAYYFNQFKSTGEVSNCDLIQDYLTRANCKSWDDDKFNEAITTNDPSICEEIIDEEKRQMCLDNFNDSEDDQSITEGQVPSNILPGGGPVGQ